LTRRRYAGFGQPRERAADVARVEQQGGAAHMRGIIETYIDGIAGAGDMRQRSVRLVHADKSEFLPKFLGRVAVRRGQRDLEKIAA